MSDYAPPGADPAWLQAMMEYQLGYNPIDPTTSMLGMQPNAPVFSLPQFQGMYGAIPQGQDALDFSRDSANYLQDYANITMDPAIWMSAGTSALSPQALAPQMTQSVIDRPGMRALEAYRSRPNTFEGLIATEILDNGGTGNSAISKMRQVIEAIYDPSTGEVRRDTPAAELDPELVAQAEEYRRMLGTVTIDGIPTVDYNTAYDNAAAMERAYLEDPQPGRTGAIYNDAGEMVSQGGELTIMYDENGNEQLVETRSQEAPMAAWLRKNGLSSPFDQYTANDFMSGDWAAQQQQYFEGESQMRDAMEAYQRESDELSALRRGTISPQSILGQFDPSRHVVPPATTSGRTTRAEDIGEVTIDPDALNDQWAEAQENGAELPGTRLNSGVYMPDFTSPDGAPPSPEFAPLITSMNENIPQVGSATNWTPEPGHIFPGEPGYEAHLAQHENGQLPSGGGAGGGAGNLVSMGGVPELTPAMEAVMRQIATERGGGQPPAPGDDFGGGDFGGTGTEFKRQVNQAQAAAMRPGAEGLLPDPMAIATRFGEQFGWTPEQTQAAVAEVARVQQGTTNYGGTTVAGRPPGPGERGERAVPSPTPPYVYGGQNQPQAPPYIGNMSGSPFSIDLPPASRVTAANAGAPTGLQPGSILTEAGRSAQQPPPYIGNMSGSPFSIDLPPASRVTAANAGAPTGLQPGSILTEAGRSARQPPPYVAHMSGSPFSVDLPPAMREAMNAQVQEIETGERPSSPPLSEREGRGTQTRSETGEPVPGGLRDWRSYVTGERGWGALADLSEAERTKLRAVGQQAGERRTAKKERNRIFQERETQRQSVYNYEFGVAQARAAMAREAGITPYSQQMLARRMVPMAMGLSGSGYLPGA